MAGIVLVGIAAISFLASAIGSLGALLAYPRKEGASLLGFGFANYFYGPMREEKPRVFWMSIGSASVGVACFVLAAVLR